jgi:hypothetical protein
MDMHHKFTIVFIENVIAGCSASRSTAGGWNPA